MTLGGWKRERLGRIADLTMGQSPDSKYYSEDEVGLPFLQGCAEFSSRFPVPKQYCTHATKIAPEGSILLSVRAPVGKLNIADRSYIIGRGLAAIVATEIDQRYLEYGLSFQEPNLQNASQGSTFQAINSSELSSWSIGFPDEKAEQSQIAEILSTVDRAIEQTEALIAKQQRIKTGLMQDLLTRGIDEQGNLRSEDTHEFKDSPLGRIPVEWDVYPLSSVATEIVDCPHTTPRFVADGVLVVRTFNIKAGRLSGELSFVTEGEYRNRTSRLIPQARDVVFTREAPVGEALVIPEKLELCLGQRTMLVRCNETECLPHYLLETIYFERTRLRFDQITGGTTNPHLNVADIRNLSIAVPRISEQNRICDSLNALRQGVEHYEIALKKLRVTKTALMQDLLTGKKRVTPLLEREAPAHQTP